MVQLFEEVDRLRREADEVQAKLLEVKTASDLAHQAHIQAIEEVRDLEKMLHAARARALGQPEVEEPPKEEDLFARFKKGGKISTEDLMALQKSPR
ncbi:phosphoserine phosphatase [mine drainage metagenome]|uniref:Phosphoserine phosphatase n=1 Tax=mine drainage metagenome TaxID=410659 RepID=T0ZJP1_9ZZZZ